MTKVRQIPTDKFKYAGCLATVAFSQDASTQASQLASQPAKVAKYPHCPDALNSNAADLGEFLVGLV